MDSTSITPMDGNLTTSLSEMATPSPEEVEYEAKLITVLILLSLFMVFGVVGNALAFYIYYKKRDKTTSNVFILALAATDFIVCLIVVPYTMVAELIEYKFIYDIPCKLYMFCITSNIPLSAFIMTAIAFDRYFCICHPFLHILTVPRAKYTCFALTILSAFLGVITALNFGVYQISNSTSNSTNVNETADVAEPTEGRSDAFGVITSVNDSITQLSNDTGSSEPELVYIGVCVPSEILLSMQFVHVYQKLYAATFLVSLLLMAILYALIYRSILVRRRWRNKRKRMSCYTSVNGVETQAEETQLTTVNGNNAVDEKKAKRPFQNRQAAIREKTLYANVKTAAMLFVVTVVFIISFLPAWLMGLGLIPGNVIVFNLYFLNNVANPVIYAFMNRTFRDDLKALIKGCK